MKTKVDEPVRVGPWRGGGKRRSLADVLSELENRSFDGPNGCREWAGLRNRTGYGQFSWKPSASAAVIRTAHRVSYSAQVGPIPEGLVIDHLCRNRACINVDHLEAVTPQENVLRSEITWASINRAKTHCPHGHEFSIRNTYVNCRGWRTCRPCLAIRKSARRAKKAAQGRKAAA